MKMMVVILSIIVLGIAFLVMPVAAQSCGEEILDDWCECSPCAEDLNLQVTPTCDGGGGLGLTWNDIGAEFYQVVYFDTIENAWYSVPGAVPGTSCFIPNAILPPGTYSFAVIPYDSQSGICYSNIVCDVEFPTTCTNIPEFPSIFLPATMIIGFLGAVLLIQRTREQ